MKNLKCNTFQLYKNGKEWKILTIEHNLPDTFGLSIQNAFDNWIARTNTYTEKSFCDYIKSKSPLTIIANPKQ